MVHDPLQAAYHGVPIVALPFFADQPANADKAVARVRRLQSPFCLSLRRMLHLWGFVRVSHDCVHISTICV